MQQVKIALAQGQVTILDNGVTPGQKIVVDGADRLRPGALVQVSQARQATGAQGGVHGAGNGSGQGAASDGGKATGQHQHKEQQ
jgi:multidrug efflux system membrane fusion protein